MRGFVLEYGRVWIDRSTCKKVCDHHPIINKSNGIQLSAMSHEDFVGLIDDYTMSRMSVSLGSVYVLGIQARISFRTNVLLL
jgi:hypothetical protein